MLIISFLGGVCYSTLLATGEGVGKLSLKFCPVIPVDVFIKPLIVKTWLPNCRFLNSLLIKKLKTNSRNLDFVDYRGERLCLRDGFHQRGRHFSSTYHSPHDRIRLLGFFIISAYISKFVLLIHLFLYSGLYCCK